jgi:GTP-binding protein
MTPARPVKARIGKPREGRAETKEGSQPPDFTVARRRGATAAPAKDPLGFSRAAFSLSVHDPAELPPPGAPEIAFAGRSNAGKSSAINALAGRRRLAFVSKTPGRTQLINFFALGDQAFLVDLPGYGYAGVPGEVKRHWQHLVGTYVSTRSSLAAVVVVMDSRHPLTPLDLTLLEWLRAAQRPAHILLTKADKLSRQAARVTLDRVRAQLARLHPQATVQLFSSLKREGIDEAASKLAALVASGKNKAPAKGE